MTGVQTCALRSIFGYVSSYSLNPTSKLFSCKVNTTSNNYESLLSPTSTYINMSTTLSPSSFITLTVDLIPIKNVWGLVSPNSPTQLIFMSSDNKYIFVPNDSRINNVLPSLYTYIYTFIKYKLPILDGITLNKIHDFSNTTIIPVVDDGIFNKLPDSNPIARDYYKLYLFCKYPPADLSSLVPNKTELTNYSLFFKSQYDLTSGNVTDLSNLSKFCVNFDIPLQNSFSSFDCRNVPNGSTAIPINSNTSGSSYFGSANIYIIIGVVLLVIAIIAFYFFNHKKTK